MPLAVALPLRSPQLYATPPACLVPQPGGGPWWARGDAEADRLRALGVSVAYDGPWLDAGPGTDPGPCLTGLGQPCPGCQDPRARDPQRTGWLC